MQTITLTTEVEAKNGQAGGKVSPEVKIGSTTDELVEQFGEEVVYNYAKRAVVVAMQTYIRKQVADGKEEEEIADSLKGWKPVLKGRAKDPVDKAASEFRKMSPEDRKRFLKVAREMAAS